MRATSARRSAPRRYPAPTASTSTTTSTTTSGARRAGKRIVGIEDSGRAAPWEIDLTPPVLFVAGGEADGVPRALLARCDVVTRIPMAGFVASYNLQAAVAILAAERLRQRG